MKRIFGILGAGLLLMGCGGPTGDTDTSDDAGGSMTGAGGAGPGYDGSGEGAGKYGTVPDGGTNRAEATSRTNAVSPAVSPQNPTPVPPAPPAPNPQ